MFLLRRIHLKHIARYNTDIYLRFVKNINAVVARNTALLHWYTTHNMQSHVIVSFRWRYSAIQQTARYARFASACHYSLHVLDIFMHPNNVLALEFSHYFRHKNDEISSRAACRVPVASVRMVTCRECLTYLAIWSFSFGAAPRHLLNSEILLYKLTLNNCMYRALLPTHLSLLTSKQI